MTKDPLFLDAEQIFAGIAKILPDGEALPAELRLAPNKLATLELRMPRGPGSLISPREGIPAPLVSFKTTDRSFTLLHAKRWSDILQPEFVLTGEFFDPEAPAFSELRIHFAGVSPWFHDGGFAEFTEGGLSYQHYFRPFDATVMLATGKVSVSTEYSAEWGTQPIGKVLSEKIWVKIRFETAPIGLGDLAAYVSDLRHLFSWLIGFPASASEVVGTVPTLDRNRSTGIYFTTFSLSDKLDNRRHGLVQYDLLRRENLWEGVLQAYFTDRDSFRKTWAGLSTVAFPRFRGQCDMPSVHPSDSTYFGEASKYQPLSESRSTAHYARPFFRPPPSLSSSCRFSRR